MPRLCNSVSSECLPASEPLLLLPLKGDPMKIADRRVFCLLPHQRRLFEKLLAALEIPVEGEQGWVCLELQSECRRGGGGV